MDDYTHPPTVLLPYLPCMQVSDGFSCYVFDLHCAEVMEALWQQRTLLTRTSPVKLMYNSRSAVAAIYSQLGIRVFNVFDVWVGIALSRVAFGCIQDHQCE